MLQAIRNNPNNRLSEYTLFWEKLLRKKSIKRQNSTSETKSLNYYWVKTFDRMEKVASTITYNIPHLIATSWGQSYPWNTKCPYVYCNEDPNGKRGYTGCVAVSTAQVLYYLHYKIGKPMNFGWDGSYSSTLFTTYPSWSVGNSIYNTDTRIVYGFN